MQIDWQRYSTAAVLIVVVLLVTEYSSPVVFALLSAAVFFLVMREWVFIASIQYRGFAYMGFIIAVLIGLSYGGVAPPVLWPILLVFWLGAAVMVVAFPVYQGRLYRIFPWRSGFVRGLIGVIACAGAWLALGTLRTTHGPSYVFFIFFLVWLIDSGGYWVGRNFGRVRLSPVSPKKTWEGVVGGTLLAFVVTTIAFAIDAIDSDKLSAYYALTIAVVFFAVIGDLFESVFKRESQIKDSGRLLPGHGGLLDRLDSMLPAVPIFLFGINLIGSL